ncbi:MAG TPA: NAD-dependent protein deacylase [Planctomycetes bacterium]|jgi:NAD-dependent deacetylase|nr:NAD-dependent protein deacylase [Planctomycetaceae bacterium]HIM30502.1 NAD-dependent protein deacylase [Planctomycetota bacterium]
MEEIAKLVSHSNRVVAFTGAGISTESGIPDFRSPGGVWATNTPVMFDDFVADPAARYEYWRQKAITHHEFVGSEPNAGHRVLARWEQAGLVRGVITQNIDGLHQIAGSQSVIELHGTAREIGCLGCGERFPAERWVSYFEDHDAVPDCPDCGGLLKHATISFGQSLDQSVLETAVQWCREADLMIAVGSSLVVEPAASLPRIAQESGAALVIVNRDDTPLDRFADVRVYESIGTVLTATDGLLR